MDWLASAVVLQAPRLDHPLLVEVMVQTKRMSLVQNGRRQGQALVALAVVSCQWVVVCR